MKKNLKKGFTLIELLVVIAIIGILSGIVLASLNTARAKGADAAIKGDLTGMRSSAELIGGESANYSTVCTAGTDTKKQYDAATSIAGDTTGECVAATGTWAANVALKTAKTTFFCVDYKGNATTTTTDTIGSADFDCN